MSEPQRVSDEGTLALYDEDDANEDDAEIDVGSEIEEVAGGREELPSDLPPAPTLSEAPGAISTREVVPSVLPPPAAEVPLLMPVTRPPTASAAAPSAPQEARTPQATSAQSPPAPQPARSRSARSAGQPSNIEMLDALVTEGQWKKVCGLLGRYGKRGKLPARLALIYAIALNEVRVPGAAIDKQEKDIERFAQESFAALLQTDAKSPLVRMVVKRLLRRSWRAAPAPPTRTSVLLIIASIMMGAFIGFLLGPGKDWFKHM